MIAQNAEGRPRRNGSVCSQTRVAANVRSLFPSQHAGTITDDLLEPGDAGSSMRPARCTNAPPVEPPSPPAAGGAALLPASWAAAGGPRFERREVTPQGFGPKPNRAFSAVATSHLPWKTSRRRGQTQAPGRGRRSGGRWAAEHPRGRCWGGVVPPICGTPERDGGPGRGYSVRWTFSGHSWPAKWPCGPPLGMETRLSPFFGRWGTSCGQGRRRTCWPSWWAEHDPSPREPLRAVVPERRIMTPASSNPSLGGMGAVYGCYIIAGAPWAALNGCWSLARFRRRP